VPAGGLEAGDGADVLQPELAAGGGGKAEIAVFGIGAQSFALERRLVAPLQPVSGKRFGELLRTGISRLGHGASVLAQGCGIVNT
jgi:hypothetical protein